MTNKDKSKRKPIGHAIIYLGWKGGILPWNADCQRRTNEYFFSLEINKEFKIQSHYGMPCTQGSSNLDYIRERYAEMIDDVTTGFAQEMKGLKKYEVVNGDKWNFFRPNYEHEIGNGMSDDAKKDFLDSLESKLKGRKRINRKSLTYDYENFRDTTFDGAPC